MIALTDSDGDRHRRLHNGPSDNLQCLRGSDHYARPNTCTATAHASVTGLLAGFRRPTTA